MAFQSMFLAGRSKKGYPAAEADLRGLETQLTGVPSGDD